MSNLSIEALRERVAELEEENQELSEIKLVY